MKLHTKYQRPEPSNFRQEDFPNMSQVSPGAGTFLPQGYNLNKFGRGPLDEVT